MFCSKFPISLINFHPYLHKRLSGERKYELFVSDVASHKYLNKTMDFLFFFSIFIFLKSGESLEVRTKSNLTHQRLLSCRISIGESAKISLYSLKFKLVNQGSTWADIKPEVVVSPRLAQCNFLYIVGALKLRLVL